MISAWYITQKDLSLLIKDKRALVLLLILPLLFIAIVGMSTGQFLTQNEANNSLRIIAVDQNKTDLSRQLVDALKQYSEVSVNQLDSVVEARKIINEGDASLLLTIGKEFEARAEDLRVAEIFDTESGPLAQGPAALDLTIETRPASIGFDRLLTKLIFSEAVKVVVPVAARKNPLTRNWVRDGDEETEESVIKPATSESLSPKDPEVYSWIVPGFTVMFAFFVVSIMARSFIAERDNGTLRRLLLAPVSRTSVLAGKTFPFCLTSILQCGLLFLCGRMLFGMSWGSAPVLLIPVIICTSLAATSLGLLLATLVETDQQVSSYGTTLVLVLSSISGCFFPRQIFPETMKQISMFTPHGWALRAFDALLATSVVDSSRVGVCCGMLVLFSAVFFAAGCLRFRSE